MQDTVYHKDVEDSIILKKERPNSLKIYPVLLGVGVWLSLIHIFQVDEGEILGFLGPNGAGKSTTMNILTGYLSASDGTVKINGYDILEQPNQAKSSIGCV